MKTDWTTQSFCVDEGFTVTRIKMFATNTTHAMPYLNILMQFFPL